MNKLLFNQTGGFPLETDTLDYMQTAYQFLQAIGRLGGDNYILSGCVVAGASVGDGVIVLAGEVMEFRGGIATSNIIVREEKATRPFENGQTKDVFVTRYAVFGNGEGAVAWNTLARFKPLVDFKNLPTEASNEIALDDENKLATSKALKTLNDKVNTLLPAGIIAIWSGSVANIPVGWELYEALRDKFVIGAGLNYPVGAVGGEATHKLSTGEMPTHRVNTKLTGTVSDVYGSGVPSGNRVDAYEAYGTINLLSDPIGGDQAHNNMPPYYALAYIIKI